jgi:hypothetical protein
MTNSWGKASSKEMNERQKNITQTWTFWEILINWHVMEGRMYPNLRQIMWQANISIGVTSTNFNQCKGMIFMSK